jgi:hypothetical protein
MLQFVAQSILFDIAELVLVCIWNIWLLLSCRLMVYDL